MPQLSRYVIVAAVTALVFLAFLTYKPQNVILNNNRYQK